MCIRIVRFWLSTYDVEMWAGSGLPKQEGYVWNSVVRNTAQNLSLWRSRLTDAELERVREKCYDIAQAFYSAEEMPAIGLVPSARR